jgi:hypothetical protein
MPMPSGDPTSRDLLLAGVPRYSKKQQYAERQRKAQTAGRAGSLAASTGQARRARGGVVLSLCLEARNPGAPAAHQPLGFPLIGVGARGPTTPATNRACSFAENPSADSRSLRNHSSRSAAGGGGGRSLRRQPVGGRAGSAKQPPALSCHRWPIWSRARGGATRDAAPRWLSDDAAARPIMAPAACSRAACTGPAAAGRSKCLGCKQPLAYCSQACQVRASALRRAWRSQASASPQGPRRPWLNPLLAATGCGHSALLLPARGAAAAGRRRAQTPQQRAAAAGAAAAQARRRAAGAGAAAAGDLGGR